MRMMRPVAVIRLSAALGEILMPQRKGAMPGAMVWFRYAATTRGR
jgi:hypothetical protein